ncbi:MAG: DUF1566 domain-containing protein [Patescibacteria group bacterium]
MKRAMVIAALFSLSCAFDRSGLGEKGDRSEEAIFLDQDADQESGPDLDFGIEEPDRAADYAVDAFDSASEESIADVGADGGDDFVEDHGGDIDGDAVNDVLDLHDTVDIFQPDASEGVGDLLADLDADFETSHDLAPDLDAGEEEIAPVCIPVEEECNGADDDCDGMVDEVLVWELEGEPRWYEPCGREFPTRVDIETGLEWPMGSSRRSWDLAPGFCSGLSPLGSWRMPTLAELETLYIPGAPEGECDALYLEIWPAATCDALWSADEFNADQGRAFDFRSGESADISKSTLLFVRCVRDY